MFSKQFFKKKRYRISELKKTSVLHIFPHSKLHKIGISTLLTLPLPGSGTTREVKRTATIFPPRFAKLLKKFSNLKIQAFKRVFGLTLSKGGVEGVGQVSYIK